ncbi:MAG: hypothetical protein M3069_33770 [Chloroflexota bacterium]|nr:hypothetical protein [Chloroflexota bacterium]
MTHTEELASSRSELARLRARCEAVGEDLAAAAHELKAGGALPNVALIDDLDNLRSEFADLRRSTLRLAAAVPGASPDETYELTSPTALEAVLEATQQAIDREAAEQARRQAIAVLDRVQRLCHRDDPAFPALEQCRVLAGGLRETLASPQSPTGLPEIGALADGRHPLAYLVQFAEDQSDLDDTRWEFLHDAVSQAFGRPLAVAAARGKLWVPSEVAPPAAEAEPSSSQAEPSSWQPEPDDEDDWPTSTLAWPESEPELSVPVAPAPPVLAPAVPTATPAVLLEADADLPSPWPSADHDQPGTRSPGTPEPETLEPETLAPETLAPGTLQPGTLEPGTLQPDMLIWQALVRDRPGAAFLVASYADRETSVPIQVLRALALSPRVLYVNGDIALQLTDDFAHWDPRHLASSTGDDDVVRAIWLLALASALRPALVAPDSGAWAIVRALPDTTALPNLQRYARVIADYGEHHPPLAPHTFGPSLPSAAWRDALEDLLREIGAWRVKFLGMRSSFPPANEVWRHWLRPDGPIHALLAPLTLHDRGLETARGLVERLSNTVQIEWEIAETDRRLLGRVHGPDIAARPADADRLVQRIREAVAFARRWIALQEHRPERADDERARRARALREELAELGPAVERELAGLDSDGAPLPMRAAVVQCQTALSNVQALLGTEPASQAGAWWMPSDEPPPRLALQSDLLRVPGLDMDRGWRLPRVEGALVLRGVRTVIEADAPPDWQTVFALHLRAQDHVSTAQVIECVEPHDRALAAQLQAVRTDELERARANLRSELELTRDRVDVAAAEGRLEEQQRARHLSAVEPTALMLPCLLRFGLQREVLRRIRNDVDAVSAVDEPIGPARAREQADLGAPNGACLLVARPGMGTSTLLDGVAESHRSSGQQHVALVIDMSSGRSGDHSTHALADGQHVERFWDLVAAALSRAGLAPAAGFSGAGLLHPDSLTHIVEAWLAEDPARALLLLVDHADALLNDEAGAAALHPHADRYPTSARLARLMHSSNGRVKVVLAGSLTVLRAARLSDYPLSGGGCVCLRPLVDNGGWREAVAVLGRRLDAARAESPVAPARVLSLANYEPGTITRVTDLLAERVAGSTFTLSLVEGVVSTREGTQALSGGLVTMLRSDPRHAVIVYCLALAAWGEDADSADASMAVEGVTSGWLREQVGLWWPDGFAHAWSDDAFDDLLEELLALGLLRAVAANRFILGQPNWLAVLGTQDELIARLFEYASNASGEPELDSEYPAASSRPAVASGPAGRSPLTVRQLSRVLDRGRTASVVVGTEAAGVLQVTPALEALAGSTRVVTLDPTPEADDCPALLRCVAETIVRESADSRLTLLVPQTWAWTRQWLERVLEYLERVRADRPEPCQVIFVADPAATWRIIDEQPDEAESSWAGWLSERGIACVSLTPWQEGVVQQWSLDRHSDGSGSIDPDMLEEVTGGWPLLLESGLPNPVGDDWAAAFGLDQPPAQALRALAVLDQASEASLTELADAAHKSIVRRGLEWARLLHLARPLGSDQWRLDPIASRVLRATSKHPLAG